MQGGFLGSHVTQNKANPRNRYVKPRPKTSEHNELCTKMH